MRIDILTLFPEMFAPILGTSIPKRSPRAFHRVSRQPCGGRTNGSIPTSSRPSTFLSRSPLFGLGAVFEHAPDVIVGINDDGAPVGNDSLWNTSNRLLRYVFKGEQKMAETGQRQQSHDEIELRELIARWSKAVRDQDLAGIRADH